ncbi:MAG: hypothetical protein ACJ76T_13225, partial [Solirubrobacteraceae bacterium]
MEARTYTGRLTCVAIGFLLAFPAASLAADTYVDAGLGNDATNNCLSPSLPCKTISAALTRTGTGDTVFVDPGKTYAETVTLADGKSLVQQDFGGPPSFGPAIVSGGDAVAPAITVSGD